MESASQMPEVGSIFEKRLRFPATGRRKIPFSTYAIRTPDLASCSCMIGSTVPIPDSAVDFGVSLMPVYGQRPGLRLPRNPDKYCGDEDAQLAPTAIIVQWLSAMILTDDHWSVCPL
jgi:hypothetical protein